METTIVKVDGKGRATLRGARQGRRYLLTRDGEEYWLRPAPATMRRAPEAEAQDDGPSWSEVLKDVRARLAQRRADEVRPNPVLAERKKRKFNERLL